MNIIYKQIKEEPSYDFFRLKIVNFFSVGQRCNPKSLVVGEAAGKAGWVMWIRTER